MSGGRFDFKQYQFEEIADDIDSLIAKNNIKDDWGYSRDYPADILEKFKETAHTCRLAAEMIQRVDWLVSGDDGEGSFRERWKEEVRGDYKDI